MSFIDIVIIIFYKCLKTPASGLSFNTNAPE